MSDPPSMFNYRYVERHSSPQYLTIQFEFNLVITRHELENVLSTAQHDCDYGAFSVNITTLLKGNPTGSVLQKY